MFDHSVTIFKVWGVPVRLHWSLLLFLPYVAFAATYQFGAIAAALGVAPQSISMPMFAWGLILAVGLFVGVLLHELAHTAVALRSGGKIDSITLMMLGGVTRMRDDVAPEHEAWMAFAGPLVSFAIGALSYAAYRFVPLSPDGKVAVFVFATMNFMIAAFNLLPAFPMDGGRVLRGLLVPRYGRVRATRIATRVGQWMAVILGLFGLLTFNVLLVLIGVFVYAGASAERERLAVSDMLHGLRVMDFMTDRLGEVHLGDAAGDAGRRLLQMNLAGARVVEDPPGDVSHEHHRTVGVVTAWELARRASMGEAEVPVQRVMHVDWPSVHPEDDGRKTLDTLANGQAPAVVVRDGGDEIIGLVTAEDVRRAVAIAGIGGASSARH